MLIKIRYPNTVTVMISFVSMKLTTFYYRGVARIFHRGVTRCQNEVSHQIFMPFLPPVVGCLLKNMAYNGEITVTPGPPLATPLYYLATVKRKIINILVCVQPPVEGTCTQSVNKT